MSQQPATMLPEHACNPFIRDLGNPMSFTQHHDALGELPAFAVAERSMAPHLRRYCVLRVMSYMAPLERQVELAERIGMAIRQGYAGRDPARNLHHAAILDAVDRQEAGNASLSSRRSVSSTACGFAVLGHPGMGKTVTIDRVLSLYPQVLRPKLEYSVVQIVWLKVECPSKGSQKQFCIAVFAAIDKLLGTEYSKNQGSPRLAVDTLVLNLQVILTLHAVGVIVIDEIQHLNESKEGTKPLMNFLVTLVNLVSIPVVLVGTMAAANIVQDDFREARRATGLGSQVWTQLKPGEEWDGFLEGMWLYQWTTTPTELTPAIRARFYHETQGILDIALRLFMLCQFRAIARGEVGDSEDIDEHLIAKVAADEFQLIRPMMDALRSNDEDALAAFPDLTALHAHIDGVLARSGHKTGEELRARLERRDRLRDAGEAESGEPSAVLRRALLAKGLGPDVVDEMVAELERAHPSGDLFEMIEAAAKLVEAKPLPARKARKAAAPKEPAAQDDPADLRVIADVGSAAGSSGYAALQTAGVVGTVFEVLEAAAA